MKLKIKEIEEIGGMWKEALTDKKKEEKEKNVDSNSQAQSFEFITKALTVILAAKAVHHN